MRQAQRDAQARDRLDRLIKDAHAGPVDRSAGMSATQEWIEEPIAEPGPVQSQDDTARPPPEPWWRRARPGRLVERWVPGGTPPRGAPVVLVAVLVLGVLVAIGVIVASSGGREPPPALPAVSASVESSAGEVSTSPSGGSTIVVSIVGRVVRPGLVTLPDGARVADAVRAAGGPEPGVDVSALNIARRLTDGEQIYVGIPPPPDASPSGGPAGVPNKIDLNSASLAELDTLPGVGAVTAQRIVDWRTRHGRFTRVEQLRDVDGIGPARFGQLKDLVVVR